MARRGPDPRSNTTMAEQVDHALRIARCSGVGPALEVMLTVGVPRQVALRVLASPAHHRRHDRRIARS